jgi:hypothetical protein
MRVLREAGLVLITESRQVRGGTEQYFALVSGGFRLPGEAGTVFLVEAAMAEMVSARDGEPGHTVLRHLWLSEQQARALAAQLEEFSARSDSGDAVAGEAYGLLLSLYRADIPKLS